MTEEQDVEPERGPEEVQLDPRFELLPTDKQHVSFSEVREWKDCSYRHFLSKVKKIDLSKPGPLADFGTAVHASNEDYVKTRVMDRSIAERVLRELWEKNKGFPGYEPEGIPKYLEQINGILDEVPAYLDKEFPGWEFVDAEHQLYEPIEKYPHAFKGYIDAVIRAPGPRNKKLTWLIDWKTTSWGWKMDKKSDPMVRSQLVLYKKFWCDKTGEDPKNVRCAFILLKRTAKPGQRCETVEVSAGDVTTERSLKVVNNMVSCVKRGIAIKNRASCTYCDYKETPHCT